MAGELLAALITAAAKDEVVLLFAAEVFHVIHLLSGMIDAHLKLLKQLRGNRRLRVAVRDLRRVIIVTAVRHNTSFRVMGLTRIGYSLVVTLAATSVADGVDQHEITSFR